MSRLRLRAIKREHWPIQDRKLWTAALEPGIDFDDEGSAADWSTSTVRNCEFFYGQYLRYLEMIGGLDPEATPLARTSKESIRQFVDAYRPGHAETSLAEVLVSIAFLVRACHPPHGNRALQDLAYRLQLRAKPATPKASRMATVAELIDLGERLMQEGLARLHAGVGRGAVEFRDGLMIAMLAAHPIRRRNFRQLRIGHSIFIHPDSVLVRIPESDTKNDWPIERHLPGFMVPYVNDYCRDVREKLGRGSQKVDEGYLWLGQSGTWLRAESILTAVKGRTQQHLGRGVPVHLFRDSVATDIAIHEPRHAGIARIVLGHHSYETTEKYYVLGKTAEAYARYEETLVKLRGKRNMRELLK